MSRLGVIALLSLAVAPRLWAQSAASVVLRWPALPEFALRFDVQDSTRSSGGTFAFLGDNHHVLALWSVPCAQPPCSTIAARFEADLYRTSTDTGKTYHLTDINRGDTATLSLEADGTWKPVANGATMSAGYVVEQLLDITRLTLPKDAIAVGETWPIETHYARVTQPFGEIRSFFRGRATLDSVSNGQAWLSIIGVDSFASREGSMTDSLRSTVSWDLERGGLVTATTTSEVRALGAKALFGMKIIRRVKRLSLPLPGKPAS